MFYELASLAVHNLMRARARLAMTAGGVLVGTTAVILLIALTIGLQSAAEAGIGSSASLTQIVVYPAWGRNAEDNLPLDNDALRALSHIPDVAAVIPLLELQGWGELVVGDYSGGGQVLGIDPRYLPYLGITPREGTLSLDGNGVIIGGQIPDNFYDPESEEYQPVSVDLMSEPLEMRVYSNSGSTRKVRLTVNAILETGSSQDYAVFLPIQTVIDLNEFISGERIDPEDFVYSQIIVQASGRETAGDVSNAIRELGFNAGGMGDFLAQLNNFFGTMRVILGGVGGVALLVAAFGVANTMTMAILERTREIGLMKAIGATDRDVLTVFLIEAGLVGLSGGTAGLLVSYLIQNTVNSALANMPQGDPSQGGGGIMFLPVDPTQLGSGLVVIPTELAIFALSLATLVGIAAGLYPAMRAARMTTVVALKSE